MLHHGVALLRRQVIRPASSPPDRALFVGLSRLLDRRRRGRFFVPPETLLRWHRDLPHSDAASVWSMSTDWSPDLAGSDSRHPHLSPSAAKSP